jgi:5'-AMP-activated protein kinase regulatory gamma subunit
VFEFGKDALQDTKKVQIFRWALNGNVKEVCLVGDFNKWKPEPMAKSGNGFSASVKLEPGFYRYKFVVDGVWKVDPSAKAIAQSDFGITNSVLLVD